MTLSFLWYFRGFDYSLRQENNDFINILLPELSTPTSLMFCIEGTNRKVPRFRLPVPQICSGAKWSEEPKTLSLTTTAPLSHALSSSDRFKFTSDRRRHHHRHRLVIVIVIWLMKNHISSQEFSKWSLLSQLKSIRRVLISYFLTRNTESSPGQLKSDVLLEMICRWESIQHWVDVWMPM